MIASGLRFRRHVARRQADDAQDVTSYFLEFTP